MILQYFKKKENKEEIIAKEQYNKILFERSFCLRFLILFLKNLLVNFLGLSNFK